MNHFAPKANEQVSAFTGAVDRYLKACDAAQNAEKPPLGLKPRYIHNYQRSKEILEAMGRFLDAGKKIPKEWLVELSETLVTE